MKNYYLISLVIFLVFWVWINLAKVILGGQVVVPLGWSIFFGVICLNTLIAIVCFVVDMVRGKI
jgi:hypothetical protein